MALSPTQVNQVTYASQVSGLPPSVLQAWIQGEGVGVGYNNPFAVTNSWAQLVGVPITGTINNLGHGLGVASFSDPTLGIQAWWKGLQNFSGQSNTRALLATPGKTTVAQFFQTISASGYGGSKTYGDYLSGIWQGNTGLNPNTTTLTQAGGWVPATMPGWDTTLGKYTSGGAQSQAQADAAAQALAQAEAQVAAAGQTATQAAAAPTTLNFTDSIAHLAGNIGLFILALVLIILGVVILMRKQITLPKPSGSGGGAASPSIAEEAAVAA